MSSTPQQDDIPILGWLRDIYFSIFVISYRVSRWKGEMKYRTASTGVSLLLGMLILTLWTTIAIVTHQRFALNRWAGAGFFAVVFAINNHVLLGRSRGAKFERRFQTFAKSKRVRLYVTGGLLIVGSVAAFFFSLSEYRHAFGIS